MNAIPETDGLIPRGLIGDNSPPATPFELAKKKIEDLDIEAQNFLDGEPIETAPMDAAVKRLEGELKAAIKEADIVREAEYKPHNDAKAEIQARYLPLIGGSKCDGGLGGSALSACKKARQPYLLKVQRENEAKAAAARKEADEKAATALAAHRAADAANLAEKRAADALIEEAAKAQRIAKAAEKAAVTKTGLRTTYTAKIINLQDLARHVWLSDPDGMRGYLQGWADAAVRAQGANAKTMAIPGVEIAEQKEAR